MKKINCVLILAVSTVLFLSSNASAFESWANGWLGTDGDWSNSSNWSQSQLPAYGDGFVIQVEGNNSGPILSGNGGFHKIQVGTTASTIPGVMTVDVGGNLTGKYYILIGDAAGTNGAFVNDGAVTVDDWVGIGRTGTGTFTNSGTLTISNFLTIGTNAGGNGTFNNSGTLTTGGNLIIGQSGTGVFNNNGGTLNIAGSISLPGSSGYGTFNLNSGTVNCTNANGFNVGGTAGVLNLYDGSLNVNGRLNMWSAGAEINLIGGTAIFDYILDSTFINYGDVDITGGQLLLTGDLTADAALLGYISNNLIYTSTEGNVIGLSLVDVEGSTYTAITSVVPEPATVALLSLGFTAMIRRKR